MAVFAFLWPTVALLCIETGKARTGKVKAEIDPVAVLVLLQNVTLYHSSCLRAIFQWWRLSRPMVPVYQVVMSCLSEETSPSPVNIMAAQVVRYFGQLSSLIERPQRFLAQQSFWAVNQASAPLRLVTLITQSMSPSTICSLLTTAQM